jgi:hypothetical protein
MALIVQRSETAPASSVSGKMLEHAMAVVAKTIDPEILSLPGSHDRLMPAIKYALGHYETAVAAIPGPLHISNQSHGDDPVLNTLFPSANEIVKGLGCSVAVRNSIHWFVEHGHHNVHAVLGMRLRPNGKADDGSATLRFADHTFRSLGASADDARECLGEAAFTSLINVFANAHKERQRKWRLHQAEQGLHHDALGAEVVPTAEILKEPSAADGLEKLIERLYAPEEQMRVAIGDDHPAVALADKGADGLRLPWLSTTDRRSWLVCLSKFPLQEALDAIRQESTVGRYILI